METRAIYPAIKTIVLATAIVVFGCRSPLHEKAVIMNDSTQVANAVKKGVNKAVISPDTIPQKIEKKAEIQQTKRKHFDLAPEKKYEPAEFD